MGGKTGLETFCCKLQLPAPSHLESALAKAAPSSELFFEFKLQHEFLIRVTFVLLAVYPVASALPFAKIGRANLIGGCSSIRHLFISLI